MTKKELTNRLTQAQLDNALLELKSMVNDFMYENRPIAYYFNRYPFDQTLDEIMRYINPKEHAIDVLYLLPEAKIKQFVEDVMCINLAEDQLEYFGDRPQEFIERHVKDKHSMIEAVLDEYGTDALLDQIDCYSILEHISNNYDVNDFVEWSY